MWNWFFFFHLLRNRMTRKQKSFMKLINPNIKNYEGNEKENTYIQILYFMENHLHLITYQIISMSRWKIRFTLFISNILWYIRAKLISLAYFISKSINSLVFFLFPIYYLLRHLAMSWFRSSRHKQCISIKNRLTISNIIFN